MTTIKAWLRSASIWFNTMLLAVFPFTDSIMQALSDNLPALTQYLPGNVYKWVGLAVVVANIARATLRAHKAAQGTANG